MAPARSICLAVLVLAVTLAAAACGDDDDATDDDPDDTTTTMSDEPDETTTTTTEAPATSAPTLPPVSPGTVSAPPAEGNGIILPQPAVPPPDGYTQAEFFVEGTATSFREVEAPVDGHWVVEPADEAAYRTRVVVRHPQPDSFSGVVLVEWLNVSAVEASPDWAYLAEEVGRAGHAYVAVSVQALGVEGGESLLDVEIDDEAAEELGADDEVSEGGLVNADPVRYGTLEHPGDAWAFDIFSQVGAAVTAHADTMLAGLEPTTVIGLGESQSAAFLTTYLNALHPSAQVYDGLLVHSRGGGGVPMDGIRGGSSIVGDGVRIRTDLDDPVMIVEAETDLTVLGYAAARQDDTDLIRTWEIAGVAHSDAHVIRAIIGGPRDGTSTGSLLGCTTAINTGPHHEVLSAALRHLVGWAQGGDAPPAGERIQLTDDDPPAIARDDLGIALGGVRNPLVDVPVVVNTGDPAPGLSLDREAGFDVCALFGQTLPLDQATLLELHGSADDYVAAFTASADAAVEAGFLLPEDAAQLIEEAEANRALFG